MLPIRLLRGAAGRGAATYPAKTTGYSQDFASVADGTKLYAVPGWAAYDASGVITSGADRDRVVVTGGKVAYTGSNFNTAPGAVYLGYDTGSTDHIVRWTVSTIPASGQITIVYGASTTSNSLFCQMVYSGGVNASGSTKNVGGTLTNVFGYVLTTSALGRMLASGDTIEFRTIGTLAWLYINGIRISPRAGESIAGFTKGSRVGIGTFNSGSSQQLDDFYCAPLACHIAVNDFGIFIPGSEAAGGRAFTVSGTYAGTLLDVDYRVRNSATLAVVQDWRRATNPTISGGNWSADVFVPLGDTTTNPRFVLEVRAANDKDAVDRSGAFAVGLAWAFYGQSNSSGRANAGTTSSSSNAYTYGDGASPYTLTAKTWTQQTGIMDALVTATGRPCGAFVWGGPAQPIDNLVPSSAVTFVDGGIARTPWAYFAAQLVTARASGVLQGWNWAQGEAEGLAPGAVFPSNYRTKFAELVAAMAPHCLNGAAIGITIFGRYTGDKSSNPTAYDNNANLMRRTLVEIVGETSGAHLAHNWIGCVMTDSFHYTAAGYVEGNRRACLSLARAKLGTGNNGRGPLITGATRSGTTITLAVNLNGASSIAGSAVGGYQVSTDDFATTKTITDVSVSGGALVITLAADPGGAVKVRSYVGADYGTPTLAIGTYADSSTIPVEPLFIPITSN